MKDNKIKKLVFSGLWLVCCVAILLWVEDKSGFLFYSVNAIVATINAFLIYNILWGRKNEKTIV